MGNHWRGVLQIYPNCFEAPLVSFFRPERTSVRADRQALSRYLAVGEWNYLPHGRRTSTRGRSGPSRLRDLVLQKLLFVRRIARL